MTHKWFYLWIYLMCLILTSDSAQAIVNMEDLHLGSNAGNDTSKKKFSGNAELSVSGASGNTDKIAASIGGRLQLFDGINTSFVVAHFTYGESKRIKDTQKSFLHARHIHQTSSLLAFEGFGQVEQDKFIRLAFRGLAGLGVRFSLATKANHAFYLGSGGFYVHERLSDGIGTESTIRANLYAVMKVHVNKNVQLVSSTYYQPAFIRFTDFRLLETASLKVKFVENFALSLNLVLVHDNKPPVGVEKTDINYDTGVQYTF